MLEIGAHTVVYNSSGTTNTSPSIATTSGSCLVVIGFSDSDNNVNTITDSKDNVWEKICPNINIDLTGWGGTFSAFVCTTNFRGDSHTFTLTGDGGYPTFWIVEVLGNKPVVSGYTGMNADTANPREGSPYTTKNDELVLSAIFVNTGQAITWGNGFSLVDSQLDTSYWTGSCGYRLASALQSCTSSASIDSDPVTNASVFTLGIREYPYRKRARR